MYHSNRIRPRLIRAIIEEVGGNAADFSKVRKMLVYIGPASFKAGGPFRAEAIKDIKNNL